MPMPGVFTAIAKFPQTEKVRLEDAGTYCCDSNSQAWLKQKMRVPSFER